MVGTNPEGQHRSTMYEKTLLAGWADMDFNSHMANTAFLAKCGDVRMLFFSEHGFPMSEFLRLKMGPVVQAARKLVAAPPRLLEALAELPRTDDLRTLESSLK